MKALSLLQPWATLIMLGYKQYETRSWKTAHDGVVAIHASLGMSPKVRQLCASCPEISAILAKHNLDFDTLPRGVVLGTCQVGEMYRTDNMTELSSTERACGDYSPGRWAWTLFAVRPLAKPVDCRGALSLWTVPKEVQQQFAYWPVPTNKALAEALSTHFGGTVEAEDILGTMADGLGLTRGGLDFQATRDGRTDWYGVQLDTNGQLITSSIVLYPF